MITKGKERWVLKSFSLIANFQINNLENDEFFKYGFLCVQWKYL